MAENKTKPTDADVKAFIEAVDHEKKRADAWRMLEIMKDVTGMEPKMWGPSIIGFGSYHYKYESGREGDSLLTGFSPRKAKMSLYITSGFERYDDLMSRLGKFKTGKSCLYVNKLEDINEDVLRELIAVSVAHMKENYPWKE